MFSREILGDILIMACGAAFTYIFLSIIITGGYLAVEQNFIIKWLELFGCGLMVFIIGLVLLIDNVRRMK